MKIKEAVESVKNKIFDNKAVRIAVILIICALGIVLLLPVSNESTAAKNKNSSLNEGLEKKLESALKKMEGVGKVSVVINYDSSAEKIPAVSVESSSEESNFKEKKEVSLISGGALILKEVEPNVRGVIVVAEGAENISIREKMLSAITTLFGISPNKVEIIY